MDTTKGQRELDQAFDGLENEVPDAMARAIRWLRNTEARWIRLPIGLALLVGGMFGFLPVLGIELIPLGLLVIAVDIPVLRKPVARFTLWLEHRWVMVKRRWRRRQALRS